MVYIEKSLKFKNLFTISKYNFTIEKLQQQDNIRNIHKNLFEIILNITEIILCLPFSDWFWTANGRLFAVSNQSVHGKYNLTWVWFNKTWKIFLCTSIARNRATPRRISGVKKSTDFGAKVSVPLKYSCSPLINWKTSYRENFSESW